MATHLKILNQQDIMVFEFPPEFNSEERKRFFDLPKWALGVVEKLHTPTNKVGFILQLGYFKAVNRFFIIEKFHKGDVEFVAKRLQFSPNEICWENYPENTRIRHREIILENFGFQAFNEQTKLLLIEEALSLCVNQLKPRLIFLSLLDFLRAKKIEIPGYYTLSEIITASLRRFEKNIVALIENNISIEEKRLLDELLEISEEYLSPEKQDLKIKRYRITILKQSNQSTKPSRIKESIEDFECLHPLFKKLEPIVKRLDLSSEIIGYYALTLIKSQVFQISRREENRYLLLIAFVIHQYYTLNDTLIDILMAAARSIMNTSFREHKELFYETRQSKQQAIIKVSQNYRGTLTALKKIKETICGQGLIAEEKLKMISALISEQEALYSQIEEQLNLLDKESGRIVKDADYYDILESKSIKLQNRVSGIIKHVVFDKETSDAKFIEAIEYYRNKDGVINSDAPLNFLEPDEQKIITDGTGKFRISLYKVLLFEKIASAIKSGSLNVRYSYKYRSFDTYLIPPDIWTTQKNELLERAGLIKFTDFEKLESGLKQILQTQYKLTNENINTGGNKFAKIDAESNLKVWTPKIEEQDTAGAIFNLFPQDRFIPLFEVLSTISKGTGFLDCFEHWQAKYNREKPPEKTFLAGIIGYGCNLGIRKMAKISNNINRNELENTVNWYFSEINLAGANNKILDFIGRLQLPKLFNKTDDITHTSSDGQKFNIGVDSLNANYSYKYFGKGKGVSVYSFIDECHRLFYSTVISSSEREAAYVLDGLMHNDVVQSDIHSTDTHGYSEMIFGITHLLGISYAPRIKNFKEQRLYGFENKSALKDCGYKIIPDETINTTNIIAENWDNILRLAATIKLKETTASQLFRRLSSYSRQNPLYQAIKKFGQIIKTDFLLKYMDNVALRQDIEKQLNKLESSNKFAKAVFYGNNQEFQQGTKEEQLVAEGCKRLIQNAIICWNYLYLSQQLLNAGTEEQKQNLIQTIKNGSAVAWQHINLHGEYDFSEDILKNSVDFQLPKLLELKVGKNGNLKFG